MEVRKTTQFAAWIDGLRDLQGRARILARIERLAAGTYGLSVQSGERIPDERLEALPAAELTADEERARER